MCEEHLGFRVFRVFRGVLRYFYSYGLDLEYGGLRIRVKLVVFFLLLWKLRIFVSELEEG